MRFGKINFLFHRKNAGKVVEYYRRVIDLKKCQGKLFECYDVGTSKDKILSRINAMFKYEKKTFYGFY